MTISITYSIAAENVMNTFLAVYMFDTINALY
jgi:hypothetical protein